MAARKRLNPQIGEPQMGHTVVVDQRALIPSQAEANLSQPRPIQEDQDFLPGLLS